MKSKKVLLIEINEITWDLIDPMIDRGELPAFAKLRNEGAWAAPMSVDLSPNLDPWITWTTVYTGRPQSDHGVFFLEQPPETIHATRIWELCQQRGLRVGVFGSLCSWPPKEGYDFYVPDTFAPDGETYPKSLKPIQTLNTTYTRSIRLPSDQDGLGFKVRLGSNLIKLGLGAGTMTRIANQLARERIEPASRWRRVALQPVVNFDFFSKLYRQHRPDFATFHTNHVAHYMHTYWKAMQPELFPQTTSEEEVRTYGDAIAHGYRSADELLSRVLTLLDENTVLAVASSMGQKPYQSHLEGGKPICQVRSLDRLMEILGLQGRAQALATMSDQFNLYPREASREELLHRVEAAYIDSPSKPMFIARGLEEEDTITVNLLHYDETEEDSQCYFPNGTQGKPYRYADLVHNTGLVKSGCHDPKGMLLLYGPGIEPGSHIGDCDNLDIAPTLLTLLGQPAPKEMKGRVLKEAFAA